MSYATYFHLDSVVIQSGYDRHMLFVACINRVRNQFFHLFATAYYRNFAIHYLFNYITTMVTLIESCCHNLSFFMS